MADLKFEVLDIGARYGIHPSLRRLVGLVPVHLFEPDPVESGRLGSQYESTPEVRVHGIALGESNREKSFVLREHRGLSGFAGISVEELNWKLPIRGLEESDRIKVEVRPLSEFLSGKPAIIKLDTEGSELEILRSAGNRLSHVMALRLEFNVRPLWSTGTSFVSLDAFLADNGFVFINFDSPPNGSIYGRLPLPESKGQLIGGDGLWVRDHQAQPLSDSQIFCRVLFFYLNGLEGMGLEAMGQLSEESRQRILNSVSPSAEALTYALVLRHLKSASLYPHFGASTVDHEHQALFGCQMPDRELLFERLQRAGLDVE